MFALGSSVHTNSLSGTIWLYSVVKKWYRDMYTKLIFRCAASNGDFNTELKNTDDQYLNTALHFLLRLAPPCLPLLSAFSILTIPVGLVSVPQAFCPQIPTVMSVQILDHAQIGQNGYTEHPHICIYIYRYRQFSSLFSSQVWGSLTLTPSC